VSFCGRNAVCLLPGSVGYVWAGGQNLSDVHREPDAAWNCGAADRGYSGGGDVEPERGPEFARLEFNGGFLSSLSSFGISFGGERSGAVAAGAASDRRVGAGAIRAGVAGVASRGAGRRWLSPGGVRSGRV